AHRGGVGGDGGDVVPDPGDPVGALGHELGGPPGQPAAETGVGAAVADDPATQAHDAAVAPQAQLDVLHLAPAVRHGHEVLGAALDPLDRPAEAAGHGHGHGVLGGHPGLASEGAADVGRHDPEPGRIEAEHLAGLVPPAVGHLGGDVDREVVARPVVAGDDGDRIPFHREDGHALVLEPAPHDDVGAG